MRFVNRLRSALTRRVQRAHRRQSFKRFVVANLEPQEIRTRREADTAIIESAHGVVLRTMTPSPPALIGALSSLGIPAGAEFAVWDYIGRHKFPHFDPSKKPSVPARPALDSAQYLHRQHRNTFHDLPPAQTSRLRDAFRLRPGDRVLEAGPYVGFGTVKMSHLVGRKGRVLSAEPIRQNHELLDANLRANGATNARTELSAIGPVDGEMKLTMGRECQANSLVEGVVTGREVPVPVRRIDSLCEENDLLPNFVILTINGAELSAVQASLDFLAGLENLRVIAPGWYSDEHGKVGPRLAHALESIGLSVVVSRDLLIFAYRHQRCADAVRDV